MCTKNGQEMRTLQDLRCFVTVETPLRRDPTRKMHTAVINDFLRPNISLNFANNSSKTIDEMIWRLDVLMTHTVVPFSLALSKNRRSSFQTTTAWEDGGAWMNVQSIFKHLLSGKQGNFGWERSWLTKNIICEDICIDHPWDWRKCVEISTNYSQSGTNDGAIQWTEGKTLSVTIFHNITLPYSTDLQVHEAQKVH